ncbi:MAG: Gfo/Idh/MocA family oxidoreductase [Sedimentisphaerales bacterium]|nr:Gfo/Idh/MocA family oxidoreductase [Sedimentisphaerales bacterium]
MKRRDFMRKTTVGLVTLASARPNRARARDSKYKIAVIGRTGRGNYGHGLDVVWKDIDRAQIVAVADENAKGLAAAAKRLDAPRAYADYRRMLEKERPQIVSVAPRWLDCHRDMVLACAEFGCHVFLEKPICQTLEQADEMVAALEAKNLKLAIAHQTRYSPTVQHAQRLIAEGGLGDIVELRGRGKEDRRGGGEDLMVLGTHIMDLMRLFAGDPKWCFARVLENGKPVTKNDVREGAEGIGPLAGDEIHAMYHVSRASGPRFEGGTPSTPTMGYFSTHRAKDGASKRFGLTIYGTKGILTTTTGALPEVWFVEDPSWQPGKSKVRWKQISSAGIDQPETQTDVGQAFGNRLIALDLIRAIETNTQPKGGIYDGRAALEMILAVYESHRLNAPATFPLKNRRHPLTLL